MKEKLTRSALTKYGFLEETIERLINWNNYSAISCDNSGNFYACNTENLIYYGNDYFLKRETYMPFPFEDKNLVTEYYNLNESIYLKKQQDLLGWLFCEEDAKEEFRESEIAWATDDLKNPKPYQKNHKDFLTKNKLLTAYIKKLSKQDVRLLIPVKKEDLSLSNYPVLDSMPDFLNKYTPNHIFMDNRYNNAVSKEEDRVIDIEELIHYFQRRFMEKFYEEKNFIEKLCVERNFFNVNNTAFLSKEDFIKYYDNKVIKTIERYCDHTHCSFSFLPEFNQDEENKIAMLNLKCFFPKW